MIATPTLGIIGLTPLSMAFIDAARKSGYQIIAYDDNKTAREQYSEIISTAPYFEDFTEGIPSKRIVWSFLQEGKDLDELFANYSSHFSVSDIIIDLSNSTPEALTSRMRYAQAFQIDLMDAILTTHNDVFQLWIGGNRFAFNYCVPMFTQLFGERQYFYTGLCGHAKLEYLKASSQNQKNKSSYNVS